MRPFCPCSLVQLLWLSTHSISSLPRQDSLMVTTNMVTESFLLPVFSLPPIVQWPYSSPVRNCSLSIIDSSPFTQALNEDTKQHWLHFPLLAYTARNSPHLDSGPLASDQQTPAFRHFEGHLSANLPQQTAHSLPTSMSWEEASKPFLKANSSTGTAPPPDQRWSLPP